MKEIILSITPPILQAGEVFQSSHFKVNTRRDFTGVTIVDDNSGPNLVKTFEYQFKPYEVIYSEISITTKDSNDTVREILIARDVIAPNTKPVNNIIIAYGSNIKVDTVNQYSLDNKNITINIDPPRFYRGTANHISTKYKFMDTYNKHVFTHEGYDDELLTCKFDLKRFESLEALVIEVEYIFDKPVYQSYDRTVLLINNKHIANFTINRRTLSEVINNGISIKGYYTGITEIRYLLINPNNGMLLDANTDSGISFTIEASKVVNQKEVLLGIYCKHEEYGTMYTEFNMRVTK